MKILNLIFITLSLILYGCGGKKGEEAPRVEEITPPIDELTTGMIEGVVLFSGTPPGRRELKMSGNPECSGMQHGPVYSEEVVVSNGRLQNVIVYVKEGLEKYQFPVPSRPVTIDQRECVFRPHVVAIQAHQPMELLNSDPTLHNINARPKKSRGFNLGFPSKGMSRTATLTAPELAVSIRCDLHPWMQGYIGVLPHPYFRVTGSDGLFILDNLPPGRYLLEAWHEKLGTQNQAVELAPRQTKKSTFTFSIR